MFENFPHFENTHTRTMALGLALQGSVIYYLSTAGPGTSCKSVWSTLVSNNGHLDAGEWGSDLAGTSGLRTEYRALPGSNYQHMVTMPRASENFLLLTNPLAAAFWDDREIDHVEARRKYLTGGMTALYTNFIARLNAQITVPLLTSWASNLWQEGLKSEALTTLDTYGDCLGAWILKKDFDWLPVVQFLLQKGAISF